MHAKRVVVVDDHPVLRAGILYLLQGESDIEVCGQAGSVEEALRVITAAKPDLVIADLALQGRNGLELIKDLKALDANIPVLVISMHDEKLYGERVLRAGGRGYIMKESAASHLVKAIREVLDGNVYISQSLSNTLVSSMTNGQKGGFPLRKLTDRELEVFELIGRGVSPETIADQLHISVRTVDAHRTHIRTKLGLADSNALLRYAVRWFESGNEILNP